MLKRILLAGAIALVPVVAIAQSTVIQGGSFTAGQIPKYNNSSGQPTVTTGGTSAGGSVGVNPSTLGITSRGTGTAPYVGQGAGPNGENFCMYDAPTTNAAGYHSICLDPNVGNSAVISTQAGGSAAAQGLKFIIDGTTYTFPDDFPQIPVEVTEGGTGRTSLTAYNLLVGDGTNDVGLIAPSATSGIPLVSQGSAANPAYGTAAIAGGGTGATTANAALNNLLPSQTGQNGKVLATDGTNSAWTSIPGTGTVTQIDTDATLQGGPITTSGTLGLADAADGSILANISGGAAQPTATTLTAILDDQVGSGQGTVLMRGAATWGALPPGTTGLPLLSNGPGNDLSYSQLSINNLAIAGQTQGDLAYFDGAMWTRLGIGTSGQALSGGTNPVWQPVNGTQIRMGSDAQGDILYFNGTNYVRLGAGTNGQYLQTQGAGANPQWATGATVTPWVTYTPTITGFGTPSGVSVWSRRVGDTLEIRGKFTIGTATGVEAQMTLGFNGTNANVTSDATKVPSIQMAGPMTSNSNLAGSFTTLIESNVGYITFGIQYSAAGGLTKVPGNGLLPNGTTVSFLAQVPISGW